MRHLSVIVLFVGFAAQAQGQDGPAEVHAAVGRAWTAMAQGRPIDAVRAADEALRASPRSHEAIAVKIAALASADAGRALDAYESWIKATEDVFLLEPIAQSVLESIAGGNDAGLRVAALERLARTGVGSARGRLAEMHGKSQSQAAATALARLGDREAGTRLVEAARSGGVRPEAAAQMLAAAGQAGIPALRELLKNPAPPVRAEAARALGRIGATAAIEDLRVAMADPNPLVNASAAVALTKLGDPEGETRTSRMLESDLPDFRLMAAEAYAGRGEGPWVAAIAPLLRDSNGLIRLQAAALVAPIDPDAARGVLVEAAGDQNPVVRGEAVRVLSLPSVATAVRTDVPLLRKLLRDGDPAVRLHAAELIMELAGL